MEVIRNGGKKYLLVAMISKKSPITRNFKIVTTASGEFIRMKAMRSHPKMSHISVPIG